MRYGLHHWNKLRRLVGGHESEMNYRGREGAGRDVVARGYGVMMAGLGEVKFLEEQRSVWEMKEMGS